MRSMLVSPNRKNPSILKNVNTPSTEGSLLQLAFDNSLQANIIFNIGNGKILIVNKAACKLLGYSKKELLAKTRADVFDTDESSFKKMIKERAAEGNSVARVTVIKKSGKSVHCEISSAVFTDEDGIEKSIISFTDMSQSILKQRNIDTKKEKIVSDNIVLAKSEQKKIDARKEKIVADNIELAKSDQKKIDVKKEKIVADNIVLAKSEQKKIDIRKEKIVADNIELAKSDQKRIDVKKEKIVADNIALAKSEQKEIDIKNEKVVADNIVLAKSVQKEIDVKKEKIVADNIILAKSEQRKIDIKKDKIVADNIELAKSEQKEIDIKRNKIVADNIELAKSEQKEIDIKKEKIVADNIVLARSKQKDIDTKNGEIVAGNIITAQERSDARSIENSVWRKNMGKTSYDVMWDWNIANGQVYVGDSIEEVFGYKVGKNTASFKDFTRNLLPEKRDAIEKKITAALDSDTKSWEDAFKFRCRNGRLADTVSRAIIVRNQQGKAIRLIGAIKDVSRLQQLEQKLDEKNAIKKEDNELFHLAAKLSFDVIWDWDLLTDEVFRGEGYYELLGDIQKNNKGNITDWKDHLHPDDKESVEKGLGDAIASSATHWEQTYRFIRDDGYVANIFDRAIIVRGDDGTANRMVGAMHDITVQKELEEKLAVAIVAKGELHTEFRESSKLIFNSSSDVLFDSNLATDEITISDAYEKEFGYKITGNRITVRDWLSHIHPDDKEMVIRDYRAMLASAATEWKYSYRFLRADNSVANISTRRFLMRKLDGRVYRVIGSMQDISKQKILEEKLDHEIKLKEKQIAEATQDAKEAERSDIGKELHDNVNQLLGVSKLYLEMAKRGGKDSEMHLTRSSEYTLAAIEEIRKLTKGLTTDTIKNLGLCEAIDNIVRDTMEVNTVKISCSLQSFIETSVNSKFKLNLYRIVQEQLNNILKHANATAIRLNLVQTSNSIVLCISDDGIGFDTGQKQKGIGITNIKSRAASYDGIADFVSQPGAGCVLTVTFPVGEQHNASIKNNA